ncbi:hypothetical protein HG530_002976 [Fusarium avenaceum]|nr:hypothetical protein HG530_002976 [Fusarium avenaceum]
MSTVQVVPLLALFHALEYLVKLDLVFSKNLITCKIAVILDYRVIGTLQLLGLMHLFAVQEHDCILGLLHSESENTLVGRRRRLVLSLGILDSFEDGEETNITGDNTTSLAVGNDLQSLVFVDIELFNAFQGERGNTQLLGLAEIIMVEDLHIQGIIEGSNDDVVSLIPSGVGVIRNDLGSGKLLASVQTQ